MRRMKSMGGVTIDPVLPLSRANSVAMDKKTLKRGSSGNIIMFVGLLATLIVFVYVGRHHLKSAGHTVDGHEHHDEWHAKWGHHDAHHSDHLTDHHADHREVLYDQRQRASKGQQVWQGVDAHEVHAPDAHHEWQYDDSAHHGHDGHQWHHDDVHHDAHGDLHVQQQHHQQQQQQQHNTWSHEAPHSQQQRQQGQQKPAGWQENTVHDSARDNFHGGQHEEHLWTHDDIVAYHHVSQEHPSSDHHEWQQEHHDQHWQEQHHDGHAEQHVPEQHHDQHWQQEHHDQHWQQDQHHDPHAESPYHDAHWAKENHEVEHHGQHGQEQHQEQHGHEGQQHHDQHWEEQHHGDQHDQHWQEQHHGDQHDQHSQEQHHGDQHDQHLQEQHHGDQHDQHWQEQHHDQHWQEQHHEQHVPEQHHDQHWQQEHHDPHTDQHHWEQHPTAEDDIVPDPVEDATHHYKTHQPEHALHVDPAQVAHKGIFAMEAVDIHGQVRKLSEFAGKPLLIVNVASKCGFTDSNYKGLQAVYDKYHKFGLEILAFPCNQFGHQEPGTEAEIESFCTHTYHTTFPLFQKVEVNGPNAHPIFKFLKQHLPETWGGGGGKGPGRELGWNFQKFMVDREGLPTKMRAQDWDQAVIENDVYEMLTGHPAPLAR